MAGAGFKTFSTGEVLTASDVNTYLMQQAIMVFASDAARDSAVTSPSEGMLAYITGDDRVTAYNGSAWQDVVIEGAWDSWTPTMTQSGSVTFTNTRSRYVRQGRLITMQAAMDVTGSGTSGNDIIVGNLPVTAAAAAGMVGSFYYLDSGSTIYSGTVLGSTTTTLKFFVSGNGNAMGTNPAFACASGDLLRFEVTYEAAS